MTSSDRPGLLTEMSDEAFVQLCYRRLLGREPDEGGHTANVAALRNGLSRFDVIQGLVTSSEYYTALTKKTFGDFKLPRLQEMRPDNFEVLTTSPGVFIWA